MLSWHLITLVCLYFLPCKAIPPPPDSVTLVLGGQGDPSVVVLINGVACDAEIPDVPQPYGELGR